MPFSPAGLFDALGALPIARTLAGISRFILREHGPQGFNIRFGNAVRKRFGLSNMSDAFSVINMAKDNVRVANDISRQSPDDMFNPITFPTESNIMGEDEGLDRFVVSGTVTILDADGDLVGRVPFVLETNAVTSISDIRSQIGEDVFQTLDNSPRFSDDVFTQPFHPGRIELDFVAKRG